MTNLGNLFSSDGNGLPDINSDRVFGQSGFHEFMVAFRNCGHIVTISARVIFGMKSNYETIMYINTLKCPECEDEFNMMERKLNGEVNLFIKYGGKL